MQLIFILPSLLWYHHYTEKGSNVAMDAPSLSNTLGIIGLQIAQMPEMFHSAGHFHPHVKECLSLSPV